MRSDDARLLDMLIAARRISQFTQSMTFADFETHEMAQSAVIREFQVVGEAARLISDKTKQAHPQISWHVIAGMRNRLIHGYFAIRLDVVWQTAQDDIPVLIQQLESLVPSDEEDKG